MRYLLTDLTFSKHAKGLAGSVPTSNTEAHVKHLYELFFLANKLRLIELEDKTMDTIQDMAKKYDLKDELIRPSLVVAVIQNTPKKTEGLRRFCIYQMAWVYLSRWINEEGKMTRASMNTRTPTVTATTMMKISIHI